MIVLKSDEWLFVLSNKWFVATSKKRILQQVTSDFLQQATSATSNEWILQWITSEFLQRATSATSNKRISQRVTSDFLQRAASAMSNERILQRVTSNFTTSNEQRVKSYDSEKRFDLKADQFESSRDLLVFKTSWRLVLKTSWRHYGDKQNTYWGYLYLTNLNVYLTNLFHKSTSDSSKANQKCIN